MKSTDSGAQPDWPRCRGRAGVQWQHRANSNPATAQVQLQIPHSLDPSCLLPTLLPGRYIHGLTALVLQRRKFTFSANSPCFPQQTELSPSLSTPLKTVGTGSLCPVHSIKRHIFQHEERRWETEHSSRQQINAGPALVAGGWNLGKLGLK